MGRSGGTGTKENGRYGGVAQECDTGIQAMTIRNGSKAETKIYMPVLSPYTDTIAPATMKVATRPYNIEGQALCLSCCETYTFHRVDGKPKCHRCDGLFLVSGGG